MFDYIEIEIHFKGKDTPFLWNLEQIASYNNGKERYQLRGCGKKLIDLWWNGNSEVLEVKGSFMYFMQGHNFTFSPKLFNECVEYIGRLLGSRYCLYNGIVNVLEVGTIVEVDKAPEEYIKGHCAGKGLELAKDDRFLRMWEDRGNNEVLKMYDEGKRVKQMQSVKDRKLIEGYDPKKYFLKFEVHYNKLERVFNDGVGVRLYEILTPGYKARFSEDVYGNYKKLIPMKTLMEAKTKNELHLPDICVRVLVEMLGNQGVGKDEAMGMVNGFIKKQPLLNKGDKQARRNQIKSVFEKLEFSEVSDYDLSEKIKEGLSVGGDTAEYGGLQS